jgi:hypothetical protein
LPNFLTVTRTDEATANASILKQINIEDVDDKSSYITGATHMTPTLLPSTPIQ